MTIKPFAIERYFAKHEFSAKFLLSASDCEALEMSALLKAASAESMQAWQQLKINYTESQGHPRLRELIASLYPSMNARHVLVAAPEELIYLAMRTQLTAGDHVVVLTPCYQSLFSIAEEIGCSLSKWPLKLQDGRWQLNVDELKAAITSKTRMLVINFPNNPTGFVPTLAQFKEILQVASDHGLTVFCDEMYRLLEYDGLPLPSASSLYAKAIGLSGFSKSFALPGLRLGWVTTQDQQVLAQMLQYKDYTTICNGAPSEILGIMALEQKDKILARNVELISGNIAASKAAFAKIPQFVQWVQPAAGSIAFPKWVSEKDLGSVAEDLVAEYGVMVVPGEYFLVGNDHFRVGLGRSNYQQALQVFCEALARLG